MSVLSVSFIMKLEVGDSILDMSYFLRVGYLVAKKIRYDAGFYVA